MKRLISYMQSERLAIKVIQKITSENAGVSFDIFNEGGMWYACIQSSQPRQFSSCHEVFAEAVVDAAILWLHHHKTHGPDRVVR